MADGLHPLAFVGRFPAGDGVMLQVAGPVWIILLSIWGIQLEFIGRSWFVDSLLRYGRDNVIGIFRKFLLTVPLTDRTIIMRLTLSAVRNRNAWISQ
jgi:hypothetical protein